MEFDHSKFSVSDIDRLTEDIVSYLRQDIRMLAGVMKRAQEIYMEEYAVDIVDSLTIPSMALKIFRSSYYDSSKTPINTLSFNEDSFIRGGYYGGRVDMYSPYGKDLFFYDVNSLYPSIMKKYPGG